MMMMLHQPTTKRHKKIMLQHTSNGGGGRRVTSVPATAYLAAVVVIFLTTTCSSCEGSPCQSFQWWDPFQDKCIPCTECSGQKIVLRPCQLHRDTICGSIYDLEIDWMLLAKTEPNWKERRKEKILLVENENSHNSQEDNLEIDWQLMSLILVVVACLLFFVAAACILIQHLRQWRQMERRLDKDVEELSAKLMARLAEVQSLEGGTFYIEDASSIKIQNVRPQQMLLIGEKHTIKPTQPGNVYIEEASSKG
ncbi:tumor necrosis factor receptor superfamily member wengen [Episyrphus balteatus]|uniref:tumor necrosis factor receptor superfamily member wengen n=1 Tax=Episyrphus balteatus TaxID=286459 RepID=UPI002486CAF2|nr:tumor necrosis factor receptor superfamily member wengen [Episyrphus balteatus]